MRKRALPGKLARRLYRRLFCIDPLFASPPFFSACPLFCNDPSLVCTPCCSDPLFRFDPLLSQLLFASTFFCIDSLLYRPLLFMYHPLFVQKIAKMAAGGHRLLRKQIADLITPKRMGSTKRQIHCLVQFPPEIRSILRLKRDRCQKWR